jgi:CPA2 family monovalent cation:H+ antiporter-2
MMGETLVPSLLAAYLVALVLLVLLGRVGMPPLVALLVAGALTGPSGLGLIRSSEAVDALAEIGVALLLFTAGLEVVPADARGEWRRILVGGTLQLVGTVLAAAALLVGAGYLAPGPALAVGVFVALSSTAIVVKGLSERNELHAPHGRLLLGVLLLQDLAVVGAMLAMPALSGEAGTMRFLLGIGRVALVAGVVAGAARLVLPLVLGRVTGTKRHEAFALAIALASVGTAWVMAAFGVPLAIGAFLGGLVLAGSPYSHQAHAEVRPLRDLLASLFFISVGMLLDLGQVAARWPQVLGAAAAIIAAKAVLAAAALGLAGAAARVAVAAGVGLAPIGEFSFLFGRAARDAGLFGADLWQILLAASLVTMVATPALLAVGPALGARLARGAVPAQPPGAPPLEHHVIIVGFGLGGRLVARGLREIGVPYVVLELNGETVQRARAEGEAIWYGDAVQPASLAAVGVARARALVGLLSDPDATLRMVKAARAAAPALPIIVRTRYRREAERLERAGATVAVAEEQEASLEVLAQLFVRLGMPDNLAVALLDVIRHETVRIRPVAEVRGRLADLAGRLGRLPVASHRLLDGDWAVGRTIADLNLRAESGASILAIERDGDLRLSPPPDYRLAAGETLHLVGEESDLRLAIERLKLG